MNWLVLKVVCLELQGQSDSLLQHGNIGRAVRVLERMENQNTFKELAMDFKVRHQVMCHVALLVRCACDKVVLATELGNGALAKCMEVQQCCECCHWCTQMALVSL